MGKRFEILASATIEAGAPGADGKPALARLRITANTGAPMALQGWKNPVAVDLAGLVIGSQKIPIRLNHDSFQGVGHTESIGVENGKLMATGVISRTTEAAREVRESAKAGFPWRASIGAQAHEVDFVRAGEKGVANGREYDGPVNIARKSSLGEISLVDLAADPMTDALIADKKRGDLSARGGRSPGSYDVEDDLYDTRRLPGESETEHEVRMRRNLEKIEAQMSASRFLFLQKLGLIDQRRREERARQEMAAVARKQQEELLARHYSRQQEHRDNAEWLANLPINKAIAAGEAARTKEYEERCGRLAKSF